MRDARTSLILAAIAALALGCEPAARTPATFAWNDAAAQENRARVEATMNAFATMDTASFREGLAEDVVAFEMDLENKPVRLGSRAEVLQWAEGVFGRLRKMGATLRLDFRDTNCRSTATLGYCTVEFDLVVSMPDGETMTQPTRNSILLRKGDAGWQWQHWHSSPAAAPPASTPAAPQ